MMDNYEQDLQALKEEQRKKQRPKKHNQTIQKQHNPIIQKQQNADREKPHICL